MFVLRCAKYRKGCRAVWQKRMRTKERRCKLEGWNKAGQVGGIIAGAATFIFSAKALGGGGANKLIEYIQRNPSQIKLGKDKTYLGNW